MKTILRWVAFALACAAAFGLGLAWPVLVRPPLVVGQDATSDAASLSVTVSVEDAGGRVVVARPAAGTPRQPVLVVIYPGGLVRPQAYEWLARRLAGAGYLSVIPEFAFDLAVTQAGRASAVIARYGDGMQVVLAGHSLGGAMAAQYLADEMKAGRTPVAGLVLMGAYPPDGASLAALPIKALSLQGEHDQVAAAAKVEAGMALLPPGSRRVVIPGSVHSFFGRYGPQAGDGTPTVSRAAAEADITEAFQGLLVGLG